MKALILGSGGQVGRALTATAPAGAGLILAGRGQCDIGDEAAVAAFIREARPQVVINAAAYTAVDLAEREQDRAHSINAGAPGWIASACALFGARLVHLSTDFVFNGAQGRPYRPDDRPSPLNVYGRTKWEGEERVLAAGADALIVRTGWVYGAHGRNFLRSMLDAMMQGRRLTIVDDQIGTPTHAEGLAAALWRFAESGATGIHHYSDAGVASWYDFAVAIGEEAEALGLVGRGREIVPISTGEYPTPARRPHFSVLDKTSSWALLGKPAPHWRDNVRACLRGMACSG